jgi:hypothetical protein
MPNAWVPLIPLVVFAVVIPLIIWGSITARRRTAENLQKLAGRLGLEFQPAAGWTGSPRVSGNLRGKPVEVFTYSTGSGKTRKTWAAISVQPAGGGGLTFTLQKQGFGTKISELFGAREITVGDPEFDAAWFIQTNQPEYFRAALLPEIREKLMAVRRVGARGKFECNGGLMKYAEEGSFYQWQRSERFVALADVAGDLAEVVEVAGTIDGPA